MKLENQVCSLELANKLKELGVPQTSLYFWVQQKGQNPAVISRSKAKRILSWHKQIVSAFTSAELGEMLPYTIVAVASGEESKDTWYLAVNKAREWWNVEYSNLLNDIYTQASEDTEADARAKMLIYLLENNLITSNKE